uniref:Calponin-homology (CH) domain-containing protein n=1 Tax=Gongylonema pulchrum TaxID=637853 RepID=A0A183E379_9BILA
LSHTPYNNRKVVEEHLAKLESNDRRNIQARARMPEQSKPAVDLKRPKVMGSSLTKEKPTAAAAGGASGTCSVFRRELSRSRREKDGDLKKTLSHMEEKFTSASEELQAAEEELTELRVALSNAKRTIEALRIENAGLVEKIKTLTVETQKSNTSAREQRTRANVISEMHGEKGSIVRKAIQRFNDENEVPSAQSLLEQNKNMRKLLDEITEEKKRLEIVQENSKAEIARITLENNQLKLAIESERKEWDQMQSDLLVAVKVANDFKMEAQQEMSRLSEKINELQKRRQSSVFSTSVIALYEEKPETWEDKAWQRLMLGCERGSRRNALLRWCQQAVAKFPSIEITNFSSCWADGQALCCLLASFYPEKLNVDLALTVASAIGEIEVKIRVADFRKEDRPDWSLVMRYILGLYYIISGGER